MITAVFRRLGPRGALIAGLVTLALLIALVVGLLGWAIANVQAPARPSPSNAILAMTRSQGQSGAVVHGGVSARTGAVVWSASSSFGAYVASADGVYYVFGVNMGGALPITAYRMSDGAQLWSISSPIATPVQQPLLIAHGLLLFSAMSSAVSPPGAIYALDVTTHTLAWSASVPDGVMIDKAYPEVATNASMLFVGSAGVAEPGLSVTAIRLSDGTVAWRQAISNQATQARWPSHWLSAGPDAVYVADDRGAITALRPSDGAVAWRSQPTMSAASGIRLTYSGATLYECATASSGGDHALFALDPATGASRWRLSSRVCGGQLMELDGALYLAEQDLLAVRASDGAILWRASPLSSGEGFLSMQVDTGVVVAAASVTGASTTVCSTIFLLGQSTQCRDTGYLAAFDAATGAPYWRVPVNSNPFLISDAWFTLNHPAFFP